MVIHRYFTEDTVDPIAICAGLVQTGLFSGEQSFRGPFHTRTMLTADRCHAFIDFFYIYFTKVMRGQKFELPA